MSAVEQSVEEYAGLGCWEKVVRETEEYDSMNYDSPAPPSVYVLALLGHLVNGDCDGARFLYKRLPQIVLSDETVVAVGTVVRTLWQGDAVQAQVLLSTQTWPEAFAFGVRDLRGMFFELI